jgi:hypothetical protein
MKEPQMISDSEHSERTIDNEAKPARKTPVEIEALKASWKYDPCWDIEDAEGFEAHKQELYLFRIEVERDWAIRSRDKYRAKWKAIKELFDEPL